MKKLIFTVLFFAGAIASAQADNLTQLAERTARLVRQNSYQLTLQEERAVRQNLREVIRILRGDLGEPGVPSHYSANTSIGPISRRIGGELLSKRLVTPVELSQITLAARGSQVRIHSATVLTDANLVVRLQELEGQVLREGVALSSSLFDARRLRVQEIRLRLEGFSNYTTVDLSARSPDRRLQFH